MIIEKKRKKKKKKFVEHLKTKIYIISFPKTGRTWLRVMIGKALCEKFNVNDKYILDIYNLTRSTGLSATRFTHNGSSILKGNRYDELSLSKFKYANKKVIFLTRDIKDTLVSCYFQATKRVFKFNGNISEFIRSERYGVEKIIHFYNRWYRKSSIPKDFLLLRYEDLHTNPHKELKRCLEFLGLKNTEESIIENAVNFAKFENMKKMEKEGYFRSKKLRPKDFTDNESFKVRKGKIGGYKQYFTDEDINYINNKIKELGCPFEKF